MNRLELAFRDNLPEATLEVYFSALCDRTQKDLTAAVTEIIATTTCSRVPPIATIKMHLSHVVDGGYYE